MTKAGHERLVAELKRLKTVERPAVVEEIRRAREHGDLSENAEYDAAKEKQALIEARIRVIEDRLARAEVVELGNTAPDRVRFGVTVQIEDLDSGEELSFTIVGEDESDVSVGLISVTSPVARALIGKAVEDTAVVTTPAGTRQLEIRAITILER